MNLQVIKQGFFLYVSNTTLPKKNLFFVVLQQVKVIEPLFPFPKKSHSCRNKLILKRPDFVTAHNNAESLFIVCFGPICTLWNSLCSKVLL